MEGGCYRKLKGIGEDLPSGGGLEKTCLLGEGVEKACLLQGPHFLCFSEQSKINRRPNECLVCGVASFQETNPSNKCEIVMNTR